MSTAIYRIGDSRFSKSFPTVILGAMDTRSLEVKDINYSLGYELARCDLNVFAVGNRQVLEGTGLPKAYRTLANALLPSVRGEQDESPAVADRPGGSPRSLFEAVGYAFSRLRVDKLLAAEVYEKIFSRLKPDLFITSWYLPEMVRAARRAGATTVLWCLDDPMIIEEGWFYGKWFDYASMFDHVFSFSKGAVDVYRERGVSKVEWLPLFYDPSSVAPTETRGGKRYPVSYVANRFKDRDPACRRILVPLIESLRGSMHVFGSGWVGEPYVAYATIHPGVRRSEVGQVFSDSKISLNLHREPSYRFAGSFNYRTFEIVGAGCFELMEYLEGVEELFSLGSELVVARSGKEAVELAQYYLENECEREKVAERGMRRAAAEHTVANRVDRILGVVGMGGLGSARRRVETAKGF